MQLDIVGRIALVTGADSGIGRETARRFLEAGVRVAISDRPNGNLADTLAELKPLGDVVAIDADVTDPASVKRLFTQTRDALGDPDILVNAAGVTGATGDFVDIDDNGWLDTLNVNLMGAVRVAREALPAMRARKWGRIVLIGSEDGLQPYVDELPYCASKAAIINLAKGLSKACGVDNVLVNSVSPAFIATPMTDAMMQKRAEEEGVAFDEAIRTFLKEERPGMALRRRGKPEEVADMIVFLCSERASFVNGSNMRVDSGSVATV